MNQVLGMVYLFGGNFAPQGFAMCDGSLIAIQQNPALFSLLGTVYGGDGIKTFALPKIAPPAQGLHYVIAVEGIYPPRN